MSIQLGLGRISKLLKKLGDPHKSWKAVHVAGTNGKGSVCAYVSSMLTECKVKNGKFTSPHLVHVRDCITINGTRISQKDFDETKEEVLKLNHDVGASEFEVLTAVAFKIFQTQHVDIGVVEVGLGGRLDATNALVPENVIVTGITKISKDHESILGSTIEEIALEKAGIIKEGVPCVVDSGNENSVLEVIKKKAEKLNSDFVLAEYKDCFEMCYFDKPLDISGKTPLLGEYQRNNLALSLRLMDVILKREQLQIVPQNLINGIRETRWPGRLQKIDYCGSPMLLDGAHNESAAIELQKYLNKEVMTQRLSHKLTFVISITEGKDFIRFLKPLLKNPDNAFTHSIWLTNFDYEEGVEGMPWIKSYDSNVLKSRMVDELELDPNAIQIEPNVLNALERAQTEQRNTESSIVVCGSLYLAGKVLRSVERRSR